MFFCATNPMPKRLAIIDYGLGNLYSVAKAMQIVAPEWDISLCSTVQDLQRADKLVFPGVGAIGDCLNGLDQLALTEPLVAACRTTDCLAICVGYQALFQRMFEFGECNGLALLPGEVRHLNELGKAHGMDISAQGLRVPHSGWNQLQLVPAFRDHQLFNGIEQNPHVYFVHSYGVAAQGQDFVAATTHHGLDLVALTVQHNLIGCQFHPEKSHTSGQKLLRNFINL